MKKKKKPARKTPAPTRKPAGGEERGWDHLESLDDRRHFSAVARAVRDVNQMIIREDDPERLIGRAVEILTSTLGYHNAWIALFDREGRVSAAAGSGFDGGFEILRERLERGDYPGCLRRALEREGVEVVEDPTRDCLDCPAAADYGGRAGLAARLSFEGRDYGVLVASVPGRYARLEEEHNLFEELAGDLAFALRKIELAEVHRRNEEELRERERRLDLFFSQSLHGFFMCMLDEPLEWNDGVDKEKALDYVLEHQRMTMVNQAMLEQYGARKEDFVGITVGELFRHDLAHARRIWRGLFDRGRWHVETSERKMDGSPIIIDGDYICLYDDRGRITGHFGVQVDVTENKRAEKELRESELRFRAVFDRAKDGIFIETPEGKILDVNQSVVEMLGYSREELLEMRVGDLVPPETAAGLPPTIRPETLAKGTYIETENVRKDGTRVPVEVGNTLVEIGGEKRVIAIVRDISERKRAQEALAEEATRRRILVENSRDGIVVLDEEGGVFEANRRFAEMLGYSPEEVLSLRVWDWEAKFPRERVQEMLQAVDEKGDHFQTRHRRKDGSFYDVEISTNGAVIGSRKLIFCVCRDISERKRAEEELHLSEARFRNILLYAPLAIQGYRPDGTVVYWNREAERLYGYTAEEALGKNLGDLIIPEELRHLFRKGLEMCAGLKESGEFMPAGEVSLCRKDGSRVLVHSIHTAVCVEGAEPMLFCIDVDLSERKRVEAQLRLQALVLDQIGDLVTVTDLDGVITYVNKAEARALGYSREDLLGESTGKYGEDPQRGGVQREVLEETLRQGSWRGEIVNQTADGREVILDCRTQVVSDEQGNRIALAGISTDITERKRMEQELRDFRTAVEQSVEGIAVTDLEGNFRFVNRAWAEMHGYEVEELIGRPLEEFHTREQLEKEVIPFNRIMKAEGTNEGEINHLRRDGTVFPAWMSGTIVRDGDGNPIGMLGIMRDITESKRAEAEKLERERKLQQTQRLESLGVLAGGIAHDFNNILMVILGNAELALREMGRLSPARESVTEISVASRQAAELCKQMLSYAGRASFDREPLDLVSLIRDMDHLVRISISRGVVLEYDLQPAAVEGDPAQLRQVVLNLVINASEAIGGRNGVVNVTTGKAGYSSGELLCLAPEGGLEPGEYALLRVSDNGCGMDEETRRRVFEPFFTTKFTGRGLGMAAVLGIVQGHQGAISVESEPGAGTTFQVIFPALGSRPPARPAEPGEKEVPDWTGTGTILVAEDEDRIRTLAVRILEDLGFAVLTAADGREAVEIYRERGEEIDLVILDLTMPRLDGSGALEEILRHDPAARVIITSGFSEEELGRRFRGRGLAGILQKPYDLEAFTTVVRRALENQGG